MKTLIAPSNPHNSVAYDSTGAYYFTWTPAANAVALDEFEGAFGHGAVMTDGEPFPLPLTGLLVTQSGLFPVSGAPVKVIPSWPFFGGLSKGQTIEMLPQSTPATLADGTLNAQFTIHGIGPACVFVQIGYYLIPYPLTVVAGDADKSEDNAEGQPPFTPASIESNTKK